MPPGEQGGSVENDVRLPGLQHPHDGLGVEHVHLHGIHPGEALGRPFKEVDGDQAVCHLSRMFAAYIAHHHMQAGKAGRQVGGETSHTAQTKNEQGFGHDFPP